MDYARGAVGASEALTRLTRGKKKSRSKSRDTPHSDLGSAQLRAFTETVTRDHIPANCRCTWVPEQYRHQNPRWRLKFRNTHCPVGKEHTG